MDTQCRSAGPAAAPPIIRHLCAADAHAYRDLRLDGLRLHPESFGAAWEEEQGRPLEWFAARIVDNAVFGGLDPNGGLLGVAGLLVPHPEKLRHSGMLWGMYVRSQARGTGLAAALVARVLEHAATVVEAVRLTVGASNAPAVRLYERAGFTRIGLEPRALRVGETYYDELLMRRPAG